MSILEDPLANPPGTPWPAQLRPGRSRTRHRTATDTFGHGIGHHVRVGVNRSRGHGPPLESVLYPPVNERISSACSSSATKPVGRPSLNWRHTDAARSSQRATVFQASRSTRAIADRLTPSGEASQPGVGGVDARA